MEWIAENWVILVFLILFIAMHLFGFGCCGRHGSHGRRGGSAHKEHESHHNPSDMDGRKGA